MKQNASGGVVDCMFIKQRPCGPLARPFFQKGPNTEKRLPQHTKSFRKESRALSTHKIHSYREGVNACFPPASAQTNCINASASPPCSQTNFSACLGGSCNALNHIVQVVMCMQVLKKVGTHTCREGARNGKLSNVGLSSCIRDATGHPFPESI